MNFPEGVKIRQDVADKFVGFVIERNRIYKKKEIEHAPWPWTKDTVLRTYRFTNVKRFQDKQCRHLIRVIVQNEKLSYVEKLLNCIIFRVWSKGETFDLFADKETGAYPIEYVENLDWNDLYRRRNQKLATDKDYSWYTGAFQVFSFAHYYSAPEDPTGNLGPLRMAQRVLKDGVLDRIQAAKTPADVCDAIMSVYMLSKFFSYQMLTDFTYIPEFPFSEDDFVICGNGSTLGIDLLFEDRDKYSREDAVRMLYENQEELFAGYDLEKEFDYPLYYRGKKNLSLHDFENCLCEFSKYYRETQGTGHCKQKYRQSLGGRQKKIFS